MSTPLYRQTTGHIHLCLHLYTDRRLVIYSSRCIKKSFMSTPLYRQTTGHIQQQMYKDKVYVYTFIQADDWSYSSRCIKTSFMSTGRRLVRRLVIYSNRCIKIRFMSTPLYRQTTGHIQQQMYKDKVYVYTFIQADDWSYTFMSTSLYRQTTGHIHLCLHLYTDRGLVIYIYVYIFVQTDDWSYNIYDSRCIKTRYMSTPLYRQTTDHVQQQMYKDKLYVYTFIQADDWSYTVVDV